jgi:endonuclease YncB( thermonuclease family)
LQQALRQALQLRRELSAHLRVDANIYERSSSMPHEPEHVSLSGVVIAIFAHRFVIEADGGKFLADLGPEGAHRVSLRDGDTVTIHGERKPSEIKVSEIVKADQKLVRIDHPRKKHGPHHHHHERDDVSPAAAIKAVTKAKFKVLGKPRRKPKHFEILGKSGRGQLIEFHVELDGHIRKRKPVEARDPKWDL